MQAATQRILRIEKAILQGRRPRSIGCNARLPEHGPGLSDPVVRISTGDGATGVGWSRIDKEDAEGLVGKTVRELFALPHGCTGEASAIDLPLWDLVAKTEGVPLYRLLGSGGNREVPLYDGSIYIDDLGLSDAEAVALFTEEVHSGQAAGFRHFKIKVGRGAMWMPIMEGLERDALVIHTVREAAGPGAKIMIDANMGNTLNSAKWLLDACADVGIHWFEEPFAEDKPCNRALKEHIRERGYETLVADGEFQPPPCFLDLVKQGWIDVVQYDFRGVGLTWWRQTATCIEPWGALCGPHSWGSYVERYAHAHFAASVPHYSLLEAAPSEMEGLVLDGWDMRDGKLIVPDTPGTGVDVEPELYATRVGEDGGFCVTM